MSNEMEVLDGYTPDDVQALVKTLCAMVNLEDGELYTLRKGMLHHIHRSEDDNGLRKIRVMEEALKVAREIAKRLRQKMRGYRPDPALVISACVMHTASLKEVDEITITYLQRLFNDSQSRAMDSKSTRDAE